jgi:hypothetical protein
LCESRHSRRTQKRRRATHKQAAVQRFAIVGGHPLISVDKILRPFTATRQKAQIKDPLIGRQPHFWHRGGLILDAALDKDGAMQALKHGPYAILDVIR